jgi:hypothetical protein
LIWKLGLRYLNLLRLSQARFILAGDASVHLSGLVDHFDECSCCHCKQSHVDVQIGILIRSSGLKASNPPFPTHCSGTVLDLVLSDEELSLPVEVVGDFLAQSDHRSTSYY